MPTNPHISPETPEWNLLLDRYRAGECSDLEAAQVRKWTQESPERAAAVSTLAQMWERGPERSSHGSADPEKAFRTLQTRIALQDTTKPERFARHLEKKSSGRLHRFGFAAAACVALAVIAFFSTTELPWNNSPNSAPSVRFATANGQRATVDLPDGTRVLLGAGSQLEYAPGFGDHDRTVRLTGEAFFTVTQIARTPFIVRTGTVSTTVLGTAFSVRAYGDTDSATYVAVVDGKVALEDADARSVVLQAGAVGIATPAMAPSVARNANLLAYTGWTQGALIFEDTPLASALQTMSRWYDVEIQLADPALAARPVTATLTESVLTPELLDLFAQSLGLRARWYGRTITLFPRTR